MLTQEIIKNNMLIAEFMGGLIRGNGIIDFIGEYKPEDNKIPTYTNKIYLKYHTSWDWLIPVVEKIEKLDNVDSVITIQEDKCWIWGGDFEFEANENDKLQSTYKVCVEFIKWYNKTLK